MAATILLQHALRTFAAMEVTAANVTALGSPDA
jgi:hypothetical protein